jgi:hypothetical protein
MAKRDSVDTDRVELHRRVLPVELRSPTNTSVPGAGRKSMADASNEIEWAADRKVGFAMGILLIGVVAALFFRNEPLSVNEAPSVEREDLIDDRLRDRNVAVYTDHVDSSSSENQRTTWKHPELLNEYGQQDSGVALPIGSPVDISRRQNDQSTVPVPSPKPNASPSYRPPVVVEKSLPPEPTVVEDFDAPDVAPKSASYDEYTIRYGDTLSGIAGKLLGSPDRYQEIYNANRDRMASPDRLKVGAAIRVPRL